MLKIKEIKQTGIWNNFIKQQKYSLFVQAEEYGDFFKSLNEKKWIFGLYVDDKLIGGSLVVSTHAKRGNFLYLPYGPVLDYKNKPEYLKFFTEFLFKFARENDYDFVRVNPFVSDNQEIRNLFKKNKYKPAPMHVLAENTVLIDLEGKTEEELLKAMNKNHRNLIRRCQREGVRIEVSTSLDDLEKFNQLHDETAKRHNFHRFSKEYIKKEFIVFKNKDEVKIYLAYLNDGRLDSAAIIMTFGNMSAYRHGASLMLNKKVPSSYLIQWQAILDAKNNQQKWYNFWGVAPKNASKNHPFKGITHFKKGFGGFQKDILHCQDLIVSKKYILNWLIETGRRIKRGFN